MKTKEEARKALGEKLVVQGDAVKALGAIESNPLLAESDEAKALRRKIGQVETEIKALQRQLDPADRANLDHNPLIVG